MTISEEKMVRSTELRKAMDIIANGTEDRGEVSQESLQVATILLDIRAKVKEIPNTPATEPFLRGVDRDLDSLKVAETEQVDPGKRRRAIIEILDRVKRDFAQLGLEEPVLQVKVEVPEED